MMRFGIRWKMMLWNTAAFAVVLLGFGLVIFVLLRQTHYAHVDEQLRAEWTTMQDSVSAEDVTPQQVPQKLLSASTAGEIDVVVLEGQEQAYARDERWMEFAPLLRSTFASERPAFETLNLPGIGHIRTMSVEHSVQGIPYRVILAANLHHVDEEMSEVIQTIAVTAPITLLLAAAIAYFLAWKALAPVEALRQRTDEITAERLDRRLPITNTTDELGLLAQTINAMIGRLETSFREVHRFTGDASHELRTPLAIIRSEAEFGFDEAKDCRAAQERFSSILEECNRLTWMTEQLLALCREDAGVNRTNLEPVDLANLLRGVLDAVQPLASARELKLESTLPESAIVAANDQRLRQVFYNLLDNAFKFTPAGGSVAVRLDRTQDGFNVEICDSGPGISAEHQEKIFDRFYRVEKGADRNAGAGLGLSIVKSIVTAHGGRIEVASQLGLGTIFRVSIPF